MYYLFNRRYQRFSPLLPPSASRRPESLPSTDGNELIQPSRFPPSPSVYSTSWPPTNASPARARARAASIQYLRSVCSLSLHRHAGAGVSLEQNTFLSIQLPSSLSVMSFKLIFLPAPRASFVNLSPLFSIAAPHIVSTSTFHYYTFPSVRCSHLHKFGGMRRIGTHTRLSPSGSSMKQRGRTKRGTFTVYSLER